MYSIPWDFPRSEENFNKYIKPWHIHVSYFPDYIKLHRQQVLKLTHDRGFSSCNHVLATVRNRDEAGEAKKELLKKYTICPGCEYSLRERDIRLTQTIVVSEKPLWSFFFEMSHTCLMATGVKMLRNSFISWAMPQIQKAVAELAELVTPQQYNEMLKLLTKQGEVKVEGSLGPRK